MRRRRIRGFVIIVAAAAGAILGVALLNSPDADADGLPPLPFGLQPFPDIIPPGIPGAGSLLSDLATVF
jgi:hypothetical protein